MSDNVLIVSLVLAFCAVLVFCIAFFGGTTSAFETLIGAWRAKRLKELEVELLQAQHAVMCPRFSDRPREK